MKITRISPKSFGGTLAGGVLTGATAINDGTNYKASLTLDNQAQAGADVVEVVRAEESPAYGGKVFQSRTWKLTVSVTGGSIETLQNLFDYRQVDQVPFVVTDMDTSADYYIYATPAKTPPTLVPPYVFKVTLYSNGDPWRKVTPTTSTTQCTASPTSIVVSNGGSYTALPVFQITPKTAKTGGYTYARYVTTYNQTDKTAKGYPVDVLGGSFNHAALVSGGKALASGADWRVLVDGNPVEYYAKGGGFNSTTLRCFINLDYSPKAEAVLATSITSGALTEIEIAPSADAVAFLQKLRTAPNKQFLIDNEIFIATSSQYTPTASTYKITGVSRAQRWTTAASHTAGAAIRWLEHDIIVQYGNAAATAQTNGTANAPMFGDTSTNTSWVYASYFDRLLPTRPGSWIPSLAKSTGVNFGGTSNYYTANHNTDVTSGAADEMGARIAAWTLYNLPRTETATVTWSFACPFGSLTDVTTSGELYRASTSWPTTAGLQKLLNGIWSNVWTEASPASATTWTNLSAGVHGITKSLGGYFSNIRYCLDGSVAGTLGNLACIEVDSIAIAKSSSYVPVVSLGAENGQYGMELTITNAATGEAFTITGPAKIDTPIIVDCDKQTVTLDGMNVYPYLKLSTERRVWMRYVAGNNTLTVTESGIVRVDVTSAHEERSL
jgi:hypothetical protein